MNKRRKTEDKKAKWKPNFSASLSVQAQKHWKVQANVREVSLYTVHTIQTANTEMSPMCTVPLVKQTISKVNNFSPLDGLFCHKTHGTATLPICAFDVEKSNNILV